MGSIGCLETSVINYDYSLRNAPEERTVHLPRGESLKSRNKWVVMNVCTITWKKYKILFLIYYMVHVRTTLNFLSVSYL